VIFARQTFVPAFGSALGDQRCSSRQCRQERHHGDHQSSGAVPLVFRHQSPLMARGVLSSTSRRRPGPHFTGAGAFDQICGPWVAIKTVVPRDGLEASANRAKSAGRDFGIDIAGWLVGDQEVGLGDDRPGDGDALLARRPTASAGTGGHREVAEARPSTQEFLDVAGVFGLFAAGDPQRQGHIVEGRTPPSRRKSWKTPRIPARRKAGGRLKALDRGKVAAPNRGNHPREGGSAHRDQLQSVVYRPRTGASEM